MATPNISSAVHFVKKYPITLCVFSLLFMPSVYRLLLYFTPLLISTAIFIVAMMSWGPSMSPQSRATMRRGKRNDWAFTGSLKIYDEDEEEASEGDVIEAMAPKRSASPAEPDPDLHEERDPRDMHACAEQQVEQLEPAHLSTSKLLQVVRVPAPHANCHHAEPASINPDQPSAAGDNLSYQDAQHDHPNYHDAEITCLEYDDIAEHDDLEYHDAEQLDQLDHPPREPAVHVKSRARHVNSAVTAELSDGRRIVGKVNRSASYKGDPHGSLSQQLAERLQTLQAAA